MATDTIGQVCARLHRLPRSADEPFLYWRGRSLCLMETTPTILLQCRRSDTVIAKRQVMMELHASLQRVTQDHGGRRVHCLPVHGAAWLAGYRKQLRTTEFHDALSFTV